MSASSLRILTLYSGTQLSGVTDDSAFGIDSVPGLQGCKVLRTDRINRFRFDWRFLWITTSSVTRRNGNSQEAQELTWDLPRLSMHRALFDARKSSLPATEGTAPVSPRSCYSADTIIEAKHEALVVVGQPPLDRVETSGKTVHGLRVVFVLSDFLSLSTTTLNKLIFKAEERADETLDYKI